MNNFDIYNKTGLQYIVENGLHNNVEIQKALE